MERSKPAHHTPRTAFVLQGGGALGAYQAGAYEALAERDRAIDWVAGISIGAINAALIAGNRPERRVECLMAFWNEVSLALLPSSAVGEALGPMRGWWDTGMAMLGAWHGVPGFFAPRAPLAWWPQPPVSVYDTTPLAHVMAHLQESPTAPVTIFQVDLFGARGPLPQTLADVEERAKDIQYSSRTRRVSEQVRQRHQLHQRLRRLAAHLTPTQRELPAVKELLAGTDDPPVTLVHVVHRRKSYETQTKDYEFSRLSMTEHWGAGLADMNAALELLQRQPPVGAGEFRVLEAKAR